MMKARSLNKLMRVIATVVMVGFTGVAIAYVCTGCQSSMSKGFDEAE